MITSISFRVDLDTKPSFRFMGVISAGGNWDNLALPTYFVALLHRLEGVELVGDGIGVRLDEGQLVLVLTRYFPPGRAQYITNFNFGWKKFI